MAAVACHDRVGAPGDGDLQEGQVARIGERDLEAAPADWLTDEREEVQQGVDPVPVEPEACPSKHVAVLGEHSIIVKWHQRAHKQLVDHSTR